MSHARPRPPRGPLVAPAPPEAEVQRAILDTLRFLGVDCWRANTGAVAAEHKGRSRFVRFGVKGQSDILGILPGSGRFLAIEVKRPGNRPTADQVAFLMRVNDAGGIAFWATSARTVEHAIKALLLNPNLRVEVTADGSMDLTDEEPT